MQVSFFDNLTRKLLGVLQEDLPTSTDIKFAVAFVSYSGLSLLEPYLQRALERGGKAEFLLGLDLLRTEPKALQLLRGMYQRGLPVSYFCYSGPFQEGASIYHPKLYLLSGPEQATIVVGSSNLTREGLRANIEIGTVIRAGKEEEVVSDALAAYNVLKFQLPRVQPDDELIAAYEEAFHHTQRTAKDFTGDAKSKELLMRLRAKLESLRPVRPTPHDLQGWQKIVYDRLPAGAFKTSDIYAYQKEFQRHYPENRYIKAKVRQILQQLAALRLIRHLTTGRWERGGT